MSEVKNSQTQAALDGRLPVLPHERVYNTYGSLLWTAAVLSAASWAYLIGSTFPAFGRTWLVIVGYLIGLIMGLVLAVFAVGMPSYRYGLDPVDAAKASLGIRGSALLLVMVLATSLGWAYVLMAMTARGIGHLARIADPSTPALNESLVVGSALTLLVLVWCVTRRGPAAMERLSKVCAPGQIIIALLILGLLVAGHGASVLMAHGVPTDRAITTDPLAQIAYGVEFGFDNALSTLPFLGGLTRLVRHKRHIVGPTIVGSGVLGAWLVASVAALAAAVVADSDPTVWIIDLAGPVLGSLMVGFLLIANLGTLVVLVYVASVAIQQIRALAALRWDWVVALTLAPGVAFAFRTQWLLAHVIAWLAYNGVMFVGLAGVMFTDYFCLRGQRLEVAHLFARSPHSGYWFRGGVNWLAMTAIAGAAGIYLAMFDPVSMRIHPLFRYIGAGIPSVLAAGLFYYVGMKIMIRAALGRRPVEKKRVVAVGF